MRHDPGRILQIAHSHPRFHPGGTELTALALHQQALAEGMDSWYLGALDGSQITPNLGTQTIALSEDHRESALFTDNFLRFGLEQPELHGFLREFGDYLRAVRPDVIHFHHVLQFGLEAIHTARNTLPHARLLLTAHDYYLICANNGQLYKHGTRERCDGPRIGECPKCVSSVTSNDIAMRQQAIASTLRLCDVIAAPSVFLKTKLERFIDLDRPIEFVENGYIGEPVSQDMPEAGQGPDIIFAYFGNISAIKGLDQLLEATGMLRKRGVGGFRIHVHGAQLFKDETLRRRMDEAQESFGSVVRFFGGYEAMETARLMADIDCVVFPSVWWENAPLVVYEAIRHRRQVISYPHGGAPEILARYGVGLLAGSSQPEALATEMKRVIDNPVLARCTPHRQVPGRPDLLEAYARHYFP